MIQKEILINLWCIHKTENEFRNKKVKYIYGKQIKKELSIKGYTALAKRCQKFIKLDEELRQEIGLYTKKELIELLKKCYKYLGRTPKRREIKSIYFMPSERPFIDLFGSWNDAIKASKLELVRKKTLDFYKNIEDAKKSVKDLGIQSYKQYLKKYKEDKFLPSSPGIVYNKDWKGWRDFLGKPSRIIYPSYEDAKKSVISLKIKSLREYCHFSPSLYRLFHQHCTSPV